MLTKLNNLEPGVYMLQNSMVVEMADREKIENEGVGEK